MISTAQLDEFTQLLARRIGLRIPPDALERFVGRLHERATHLGFATLEEYRDFLLGDQTEWEEFARIFTSGETFFFRDQGQFDLLRLRLLPELIARHRNDKTLRLWSAGCASGEEAYSLAMLVDMLLPERGDWNVLILGTDLDSRAIAKARQGRYGQWSFRMVPATLQQRYFHLDNNEWVLDERVRSMVTFRVANLLGGFEAELQGMDLILCRNVFIYFDSAAVSAMAAKFSAMLVEGGYLMTAHTELIGHPVPGLESKLFAEGVVYQRHVRVPVYASPVAAETAVRIAPPLVAQVIPSAAARSKETHTQETHISPQAQEPTLTLGAIALGAAARAHADRGEYELAERMCRKALAADPLLSAPYFLLAQLAQLKGDVEQARECLNKAIYLDHRCVPAYLELAALHERAGDMPRALALRRAALAIVRAMPDDAQIEPYERTAGELAQWLAQWEPSAHDPGSHERNPQHGQ